MSKTLQKNLFFLTLMLLGLNAIAQPIMDDIDSYTLGAIGPQADHWTTWGGTEGGVDDGIVSDEQASSGTQSMLIAEGQTQDVVLKLGDKSSGVYKVSWNIYIPTGNVAYWNIQETEVPGTAWNLEASFGADNLGNPGTLGTATIQQTGETFTYANDTWMFFEHTFDLDNNTVSLTMDGVEVTSFEYPGNLGGVNFFSINDDNRYYIDDVSFTESAPIVPVTITVDMANEAEISAEGVHIAGTFQGWDPAATAMTDNGDGTWSYTANIESNTDAEYTFINGNDWAMQEGVPADCGVDNGNGGFNRSVTVGEAAMMVETVCYAACTDCATAAITEVTFEIDMSNEEVSADGVHLAGEFQGWNPGGTPMADNGDGVWSVAVSLTKNTTYEYKFVNGNAWGSDENMTDTDCGSGSNRTVTLTNEDAQTVGSDLCFGTCEACEPMSGIENLMIGQATIAPNPTNDRTFITLDFADLNNLTLHVYNSIGQLVIERNNQTALNGTLSLNVSELPADLYFVQVSNNAEQAAARLIVVE